MEKFNTYMIVYEKDVKRMENYKNINSQLGCIKFSAIDSINYFEKYSKLALEEKYTTEKYLNNIKKIPGKLGCNLSHQMLLEKILKDSSTEWNLILEDDVSINNFDLEVINNIIEKANDNNSNYIQLYTNERFIEKQKKQMCIDNNLYKMIPQWHTTAYFINKSGINIVKNSYPIVMNIDLHFNSLIKELNSLCWINAIFYNEGAKHSNDNNSLYGSLIYDNKK
jgi:GR25 family glycosyltransferase involved in LPS biosynthesis